VNREPVFDAAKLLGARFPGQAEVAIMDAAIDEMLASAAATVVVAPVIVTQPNDVPAMISADLLALVCSPRPVGELDVWVEPLRAACRKFAMVRIRRVAAFLAQIAHESDFKPRSENLKYSGEGLLKTFGRHRISREDCARFGRTATRKANQEAIANLVYGGNYGALNLGNTQPGDGWLFRGGGPLQLTGRRNYTAFAKAMGLTLVEGGIMAAAWFWEENDINRLADTPGVTDETKKINGGVNGLADRKAKFDKLIDAMLKIEGGQPL
jgi:putative chitinase